MNWLDLGIIVLIVVLLAISIKRGFMTSMLSHFSFGMNAVLSFFLCKPIQWVLNNGFHLGNAISSHYYSSLIEKSGNFATNLLSFDNKEALHDFVNSTLNEGEFNGISKTMYKWFLNKGSLYDTLHESGVSSRSLADIISQSYASFFTIIIAFVTSMILIYLLVLLFRLVAKKLRQVGFIKIIDGALGIFYGLFRCLILFIIVCAIIKLLSPIGFMQPVTNYINGSFFGKLIYSQISNFIDNYLSFNDIVRAIF